MGAVEVSLHCARSAPVAAATMLQQQQQQQQQQQLLRKIVNYLTS